MILYTKNPNTNQWEPVPAIKGTSVYLTAGPTTFEDQNGTGWTWTLYDEVSHASTSMKVYNGADGTGSGTVTSVDAVSPGAGGAVTLGAVRYSTVQSLSTAAKTTARNNIDAMKNVAGTSNGQVLTYNASSSWTAATPQSLVLPTANAQVLYSTSSSAYTWTSFAAITTAQISNIIT